ncbi:hypothetical protein OAT67_07445 [Bacteriovoracaceae bacterium]|nr:hypothetical protein [Bacteriovoracaceae bacterium]
MKSLINIVLLFSLIVCCVVSSPKVFASTAHEIYGELEINLDKDLFPKAAYLHTEFGKIEISVDTIDEEKIALCEEGEFVIVDDFARSDIFHIINVNECVR